MAESYDHLFKLLLVGDSGVGKTSILLRFTSGEFKTDLRNTVGVDLKVKMLSWRDGRRIKLTIWDTAGQERFRTLTSAYYRGAHGIILVYDITDRASFENIQHWLKEIDIYSTNDDVVKLLIGNKNDQAANRSVSKKEGIQFAKEHGMLFMECSARTEDGINQAFEEVLQKIMDVPSLLNSDGEAANKSNTMKLDGKTNTQAQGGLCCT